MNYDLNAKLQVGGFLPYAYNYGPLSRAVIIVQGARGKTYRPAPETEDPNGGTAASVEEILQWIDRYSGAANNRYTIAGGEPLDQAQEVESLVAAIRDRNPDAHIVLYTAYEWDQAKKLAKDIIKHIDVVAGGPFDRESACITNYSILYSTNQYWAKLGNDKKTKPKMYTAEEVNGEPLDVEKAHLL